MGQVVSEYQLRAFRDNGELSLVMLTPALNNDDARAQATALISGEVPTVEIWQSELLVDTLRFRRSAIISSVVGEHRVPKP
jgi:hypothetical protein